MISISAFEPVTAADLGLPSPQALSAAIPLFVVGVLMWRRWVPRVAACFALVAGASLSSGWLYEAIRHLVGWATAAIDWITFNTLGGVVPGALAIVLAIYYVLELRPDPSTVGKLARLRDPRAAAGLVTSGLGGRRHTVGRARTALAVRTRRPLPEKIAAAGVGLVLPSVAVTIPGNAGAAVATVVNVIGGSFAWLITLAFGAA